MKRISSLIDKHCLIYPAMKKHLEKAAPIYNEALKNSGFNETLKFLPPIPRRHIEEKTLIGSTRHVAVMLKQI